jgi:hypothetical protein
MMLSEESASVASPPLFSLIESRDIPSDTKDVTLAESGTSTAQQDFRPTVYRSLGEGVVPVLKKAAAGTILFMHITAGATWPGTPSAVAMVPTAAQRHIVVSSKGHGTSSTADDSWEGLEHDTFRSSTNSTNAPITPLRIAEDLAIAHNGSAGRQLFYNLLQMLETEAVEDGFTHPVEELLVQHLSDDPDTSRLWIEAAYMGARAQKPSLAAGLLRCIGRLPQSLTLPWAERIAVSSLRHEDVEVRDAAIRAFERWGGPISAYVLQSHLEREPEMWLKEYIEEVIADLQEEVA